MALHRNELYNPQVCLYFVEKCKVTTSNSISLADVNKGLQLFTKATTVTESGEIPVVDFCWRPMLVYVVYSVRQLSKLIWGWYLVP